ncbi:MAG: hypothetical protein HKN20_09270 [Gemmatimonadetes bacterium]|nr:hypothetical protein [Gemmatimonadota bacterium]
MNRPVRALRTRTPRIALLSLALIAASAGLAIAGLFTDPVAERYYELGAQPGGAPGACTIIYYDLCSGWMRTYPEMSPGQRVGVVYDLAAECAGGSGHECTNTANYWYWTSSVNGYGSPNVRITLWNVDENDCLTGSSELENYTHRTIQGWNAIPGLGSTTADRIALVATALSGGWVNILRPVTDFNEKNAAGGPACAGVGVGNGTSYEFRPGGLGNPAHCPPVPYTDALGPVNLLVRSVWNCPTATGVAGPEGAAESSSWSELKRLFR